MTGAGSRMKNVKQHSAPVMRNAHGSQPMNPPPRKASGRHWLTKRRRHAKPSHAGGAHLLIAKVQTARRVLGNGRHWPIGNGTIDNHDPKNGSRWVKRTVSAEKPEMQRSGRDARSSRHPCHRNSAQRGGATGMYRQKPMELHPSLRTPVRTRSRRPHRVLRQVGCRVDGGVVAIRVRKYQ